MLAVLRHDPRLADIGGGHGVSAATVRRWVLEVITLLATRAARLDRVLRRLRTRGAAVVLVDGTLIRTRRRSGRANRANYSGEHKHRSAVLARRAGTGAWQTTVLPHKLTVDDSHNVISMGVSPEDGRLHVGMDTHGNQVFYVESVAGLLSAPASHAWTPAAFGPVRRTLNGVDLGAITYPQFVVTPERRLQLSYRTGASGNGANELAEYSGGSWRKLGRWTSATGSWTAGDGVTSTTRNMYLHGLTYGPGGRLHAAFTWREGNSGVLCNAGGLANHDTGYVYSEDRGRTWRTNAGTVVATTGGTPVAVGSAGTVVDPLGVDHGLMNQVSQAVDSAGQPHVVISYVPGRFTQCVTNYSAQRKQYGRTFFLSRAAADRGRVQGERLDRLDDGVHPGPERLRRGRRRRLAPCRHRRDFGCVPASLDRNDAVADPGGRLPPGPHSTVTDLARLRGLSMS